MAAGNSVDKQDAQVLETNPAPQSPLEDLYHDAGRLLSNVASVVLGKRDVAVQCLIALLANDEGLDELSGTTDS